MLIFVLISGGTIILLIKIGGIGLYAKCWSVKFTQIVIYCSPWCSNESSPWSQSMKGKFFLSRRILGYRVWFSWKDDPASRQLLLQKFSCLERQSSWWVWIWPWRLFSKLFKGHFFSWTPISDPGKAGHFTFKYVLIMRRMSV